MFFTYLWQSTGFTHQDAYDRFSSVLLNQCQLYKKAFGQEPILKIKQIENDRSARLVTKPELWDGNPGLTRAKPA